MAAALNRLGARGMAIAAVAAVTVIAALMASDAAAEGVPQNTSPPTISGAPQPGVQLTAHVGSWSNDPTSYSYHWGVCTGPCDGENSNIIAGTEGELAYTPTDSQIGDTIYFGVSAENAAGSSEAVYADSISQVDIGPAFVQGGSSSTSGTKLELALPSPVQPGDLLVAYVRTAGETSVSDSTGGSWTRAASPDELHSLWYLQNAAGGSTSVDISASVSGPIRVVVAEYSGTATSDALAATKCNGGTSASVTTGATGSVGAGDLVYAAVGMYDSPMSITAGSVAGKFAVSRVAMSGTYGTSAEEDVLAGAGGSQEATFGLSTSSSGWVACVAAFRPAPVHCDLYAATTGSDANPGTYERPFATPERLADSLSAGETGCLLGGTYVQNVSADTSGTSNSPITVRSYPGQLATIVGRLWVDGSYETWERLSLDGVNEGDLPSPTVNGTGDAVVYDNVYNEHTAICFQPDSWEGQTATDTVIAHDLIHECGALPATNYDHCIYDYALDTQIAYNLIYDCADRGVQLYPHSEGARVFRNVIDNDSQGLDFGGGESTATKDAVVEDNLITNAGLNYCNNAGDCNDVYSFWAGPVGTGNVLRENCVYGGDEPLIDTSGGGFTASGNLLDDPGYQDEQHANYNIAPSSPCYSLTGNIAGAGQGP